MINNIRKGINKGTLIWNDTLYNIGIKKLPKKTNGKIILIYHGVVKNARPDINARFISTSLFERQMSYFKQNFNLVSLSDYFKGAYDNEKLTVAITFDDGYLNNLNDVLPILEKYRVSATFFITTISQVNYDILWADAIDLYRLTGPEILKFHDSTYTKGKYEYLNHKVSIKSYLKKEGTKSKKEITDIILNDNRFYSDSRYFPYFKLMNDKHLLKLSESKYADIGSHGLYHNCMDVIPLENVRQELLESKIYLENCIQKDVTNLAYPDGAYTREIINIAEKIGYKSQLAVDYLFDEDETDERIEKRFGINPYISFNNQIRCIIEGKY